MDFRLALLTVVLVRLLSLGECEAHAVVVLPCRAPVAADHISFNIFLLLVFPTYTPYDFFVLSTFFAGTGSRFGRMFGGFVFRKRFGLQFLRGRLGHHVEILVLAFGSTSGASRFFVCLQLAFVFQPSLGRTRALDLVLPPLPGGSGSLGPWYRNRYTMDLLTSHSVNTRVFYDCL